MSFILGRLSWVYFCLIVSRLWFKILINYFLSQPLPPLEWMNYLFNITYNEKKIKDFTSFISSKAVFEIDLYNKL